MKFVRNLTIVAALALPLAAASSGTLTDPERTFLIEQLEKSKANFLASIAGVTDTQWKFKPAPNVWSVAECAEHIILSEDFLFGMAQQLLKSPAVERPASSNAERDRQLVAGVEDRSHKATAPEPIVPSGKFGTPLAAASEFTKRRDKLIEYAKSTNDELRTHVSNGPPLGTADAYQFMLLLASHSARHTTQIKEVQANAGYPKTRAQFFVTYMLAKASSIEQLTPGDLNKLNEHGMYLATGLKSGILSWGGRSMDPKSPRGFGMYEVDSISQVNDFIAADPAIKAGVLKTTVEPFQEVFRAKK